MENKKNFNVSNIIGSKIYKFIDSDGNIGKIHFSRNALTPTLIINENSKSFVTVYGKKVEVTSLEELDAINNALNNSTKSLKKILGTPSNVIAQKNPSLYIKVLETVREKILTESDKIGKLNIKDKFLYDNVYEALDSIQKKITKIEKATITNKTTSTEPQPE